MQDTYDKSEVTTPVHCQLITEMQATNKDFHFHNYYELYLLLEGEISYFVEQSCYHMKPGDMLFFTNQEIHKAVNLKDTPFTRMVIHIDPLYIWQFCTAQTNLLGCFHQHKPGAQNRISLTESEQQLFQEYFYQIKAGMDMEYGNDLRAMTALINLFLMVNEEFFSLPDESDDITDYRIQPIIAYINQHLSEALTLDSIAQACSLDKYYLSHLFKKETGSTIFQYILVKRVALSKELLSLGSSVAEACQQSGFGDYANFIRSFKKITGCSPGSFKKQNQ